MSQKCTARGEQNPMKTKQFRIGRLATLGQVIKALGKTIRAMSDGSLDSQVGARICNGLGILRTCLETQKLEQLEARMGEISKRVGTGRYAGPLLTIVRAGLTRLRDAGKRLGWPPIAPALEKRIREALATPGRPCHQFVTG
jgi:hypothetical protein